jgi:proteasome accessory factor A
VATHLATAVVYAGHGQVGPGNDRAACDYQLSQRADWFEEFVGMQTTHRRPILNMRDEPHAGENLARMHIIYFDNVLSPIANYLKAGTTQLVLAMAEVGWADPALLLDDPLAACEEVSRDLTLKKPLALARRGMNCSAVEVQKALADLAAEFVQEGLADDVVPGASDIVRCWDETLDMLSRRDLGALAKRTDWALKYLLLDRQRGRRGLTWQSPEMKVLDLIFSSLDPREGLFWQMAAAGTVEAMPSTETVNRFATEPPDDTRAYLRAHVLRLFGDHVVHLDWDQVRFRTQTDRWWWSEAALKMPDPTAFNRSACETLLAGSPSLTDLIAALAPEPNNSPNYPLTMAEQREPWGQSWDNGSRKHRRSGSYW